MNGSNNELLLNLTLTIVPLNYYWTGNSSSSWATTANFATDATGATAQTFALNNTSNVFETATSPTGGTYTQSRWTAPTRSTASSLMARPGTRSAISNGTGTNTLTIAASGTFGDTSNYAAGIGLVVESGAAANTISANMKLGNSQTWEIDNSSDNALTVSGTISDGSTADALTKTGNGTLILSASNTYDRREPP